MVHEMFVTSDDGVRVMETTTLPNPGEFGVYSELKYFIDYTLVSTWTLLPSEEGNFWCPVR